MANTQDGFPILSDDQKRLVPIHGWLMGVSWGIVVPLAILLIRMSRLILDGRLGPPRARDLLLIRIHGIFQVVAIILATCGVGFLFKHLGVTLDQTHQRLGMAVMCMMWCQFFVGLMIIHPHIRRNLRIHWFWVHYLFGTGAWVLGVTNVYLGMRAYEFLWRTSLRAHSIVFSIIFALFGFFYVLQEMPYIWLRLTEGPQPIHPSSSSLCPSPAVSPNNPCKVPTSQHHNRHMFWYPAQVVVSLARASNSNLASTHRVSQFSMQAILSARSAEED